jgi:tRNA (cytidine/uridine-2'-O-)-methyltransferase
MHAMFHIVLVQPEIPPNTGNVIRLAANTGCQLHLVEPLGFDLSDKQMRRAGLDYHEYAQLHIHPDWLALSNTMARLGGQAYALTTRGRARPHDTAFAPGDWLVFGNETAGLAATVRDLFPNERQLRLPMRPGQRSLNLSNAVAVVVYEAWRQHGFMDATASI